MRGEWDQVEQCLCAAVDVLEQLVSDHPQTPRFQYELADTLCIPIGKPEEVPVEEAEERVHYALTLCLRLMEQYPNIPEYRALTVYSLLKLGFIQSKDERLSEAAQNYEAAVDYQRTLLERYGTISFYHMMYAQSLQGLAEVRRKQDDFAAAREQLEVAIAHVEENVQGERSHFVHRVVLGRLYESLSKTLVDLGEDELAAEYRAKSKRGRDLFGPGRGREGRRRSDEE
jgi:tetratricopeptide (TPR) repeat protein